MRVRECFAPAPCFADGVGRDCAYAGFEFIVNAAQPVGGGARRPPVISVPVPTITRPIEMAEDVVLELQLSQRDAEALATAAKVGQVKIRVVARDIAPG